MLCYFHPMFFFLQDVHSFDIIIFWRISKHVWQCGLKLVWFIETLKAYTYSQFFHWLFFLFLVKSEASRLPAFVPDKEKSPKYCSVNLPDGSSSKMAVKSGFSIKEVLSGLCEKHGINIAAVDLFLVGGDKVLCIFVLAFFIVMLLIRSSVLSIVIRISWFSL